MTSVSQVILVAKTHFDFGFTDFASHVESRYLDEFIPRAIKVARELHERDESVGYTWTVGSWLMWQALERAGKNERLELEEAVLNGVIAWHALPFTMHSELCDESLFRFGLNLSQKLDRRFGVKTVAAKTSDVPGHSIGIVPLLAEAGIRFLHIGRNPCCRPPRVPALFRWRFDDAEVVVAYSHDYRGTVLAPDGSAALVIANTPDNVGPHSVEDWIALTQHQQHEYSFASVHSGRMDELVPALEASIDLMPTIDSEIGDSWLYGGGSAPTKMARFRAMCRTRLAYEQDSTLCTTDKFEAMSRNLLCVAEHTWGLNHATTLRDHHSNCTGEVQVAADRDDIRRLEESWEEQSAFITSALSAIQGTPLHQIAVEALKELEQSEVTPPALPFGVGQLDLSNERFQATISGNSGAMIALMDLAHDNEIADTTHPLGLLRYCLSEKSDYEQYVESYVVGRHLPWVQFSIDELTRPGLRQDSVQGGNWSAKLLTAQKTSNSSCILWLTFGESQTPLAPRLIRTEISLESDCIRWIIDVIDKKPTRFPETMFCDFEPIQASFQAHSLGRVIPTARVSNGGMGLHGIQRGVVDSSTPDRLWIESPDAALVQLGRRNLLEIKEPANQSIASYVLFNNLWCTNFNLWSEGSLRFRFVARFSD